jgi:hypothetical protein
MTTTERGTPVTWHPPYRLRRLAVLRVLIRPRAAARLLQDLADDAATYRLGCDVVIKACAQVHYSPSWRR